MHMTVDGAGMHCCFPPPTENDQVVMGGLAVLPIPCYGKLDLVLRSIGDVVVTLNNITHVPGLGLNCFCLHVVGTQLVVVIDPVGVHVTPGRLFFPSNDVGGQLPATRKVHAHPEQSGPVPVQSRAVGLRPVADANIAPVKMPVHIKSMDINDKHISCAHAHPGILHETARQLGFRFTGNVGACGGCSMSKVERQPLRKTALSCSKHPLQRVFVDLAGPKPTQSAGCALHMMLIEDDFSRVGWTYFMKQTSDAGATFKKLLTDIFDSTKPSVVECVRSDGGGESISGVFREMCEDYGIQRELTTPDTPQLSRVVERGLAIAQEAAQAACLEAPRLFPTFKRLRLPLSGPKCDLGQ